MAPQVVPIRFVQCVSALSSVSGRIRSCACYMHSASCAGKYVLCSVYFLRVKADVLGLGACGVAWAIASTHLVQIKLHRVRAKARLRLAVYALYACSRR
jgi:hypothetical protein